MRRSTSFNSGAFRFALAIAALFALGSILLLVVVERTIRTYADEATAIGLRSETAILTRELPDGGVGELIDTITHRRVAGMEQPFRYLLTDRTGKHLAGDLPLSAARPGWASVQFADDAPPPGESETLERLQSLGTRLPDGGLLVVATDTFDIEKLRQRLDAFTIAAGLGITLLALLGGYVVGGVFLRRLDRVNASVARIMAGRLTERLPAIGMAPEFDDLSRNLNTMLDRIGDLMEGLRQVSTDIAHDLRTPLTRLRQQLEVMAQASSIEDYEAGVEAALLQIDEILGIFRALLRIGMIEGGEGRQLLASVDLSEIFDRVAEVYRPVAEDQHKAFQTRIDAGIWILGDAEMLAQVFANLLDNALKYTAVGATISASLEIVDARPVAIVSDNGPGVPAAEREKILRRFYRVDASRNAPGAGLGLSLVSAISSLHRARLSVEDAGPGLRIRLVFPAAQGLSSDA